MNNKIVPDYFEESIHIESYMITLLLLNYYWGLGMNDKMVRSEWTHLNSLFRDYHKSLSKEEILRWKNRKE